MHHFDQQATTLTSNTPGQEEDEQYSEEEEQGAWAIKCRSAPPNTLPQRVSPAKNTSANGEHNKARGRRMSAPSSSVGPISISLTPRADAEPLGERCDARLVALPVLELCVASIVTLF